MATVIPGQKPAEDQKLDKIMKLKPEAQNKVKLFAAAILAKHKEFSEIHNKMDAIDIAYARYKGKQTQANEDGVDPIQTGDAGTCCDVFSDDEVTPPIVVSQVDAYVAYLAEVFLSGSPMFPVVSNPTTRKHAEELEALLDDHASIGGYARQILMFLRDGAKYNFCALEADWDGIDKFSIMDDMTNGTGQTVKRKPKKFTRIKRLNPRNVVWDWSVAPGDVSEEGDYAGHIRRLTKTKLKRLLNKWSTENKAYNVVAAMSSSGPASASGYSPNYREDPCISNYITNQRQGTGVDWDSYFEGKANNKRGPATPGTMYELFTFYARIMPSDFAITAPQPNTPQIWKFAVVNGQHVVYAERIISAYDYLPILFGQPLEDGLSYQTQSVAEGEIPFQNAASTLFNIRFAAARRAVSDRALYIPDMIKPSDINNPTAAPKIPVHISALSQRKIGDAYMQIPFDMRGTESTIQDAATIVSFSKELHGINNPRQGSFQKGNKSVQEWNDTMGGSDGRLRLPAITLEHQVFSPLKSILALNIFQYGEDTIVTSQVTGQNWDIKIAELRKVVLSFKIADGYTPKSKLASTEVILAGMTMISQSQPLQMAYGNRLPGMFAHFMSLSGVKGFEEYDPMKAQNQPQQPAGLAANGLQAPPMAAAQVPTAALPVAAGPEGVAPPV